MADIDLIAKNIEKSNDNLADRMENSVEDLQYDFDRLVTLGQIRIKNEKRQEFLEYSLASSIREGLSKNEEIREAILSGSEHTATMLTNAIAKKYPEKLQKDIKQYIGNNLVDFANQSQKLSYKYITSPLNKLGGMISNALNINQKNFMSFRKEFLNHFGDHLSRLGSTIKGHLQTMLGPLMDILGPIGGIGVALFKFIMSWRKKRKQDEKMSKREHEELGSLSDTSSMLSKNFKEFLDESTKPGSIYTHDIRVESLLEEIRDILEGQNGPGIDIDVGRKKKGFTGERGGKTGLLGRIGQDIGAFLEGIGRGAAGILKGIGKGVQFLFQGLAKGLAALGRPQVLLGTLSLGLLAGGIFIFSKAMQEFADVDWTDALIGVGVMTGLAVATGLLGGPLVTGMLLFSAGLVTLSAGVAAFSGAAMLASKALEMFVPSIERLGDISGANLLSVAGGMIALAGAMTVFSGGGLIASFIDGIGSLFGADPVKKFERFAKIAHPLNIAAKAIGILGENIDKFSKSMDGVTDSSLSKFEELVDILEDVDNDQMVKALQVYINRNKEEEIRAPKSLMDAMKNVSSNITNSSSKASVDSMKIKESVERFGSAVVQMPSRQERDEIPEDIESLAMLLFNKNWGITA